MCSMEGGRTLEPLRQFLGRLVRKARKDHVLKLARLPGDGFRNQRMRVAVKVDPPG